MLSLLMLDSDSLTPISYKLVEISSILERFRPFRLNVQCACAIPPHPIGNVITDSESLLLVNINHDTTFYRFRDIALQSLKLADFSDPTDIQRIWRSLRICARFTILLKIP